MKPLPRIPLALALFLAAGSIALLPREPLLRSAPSQPTAAVSTKGARSHPPGFDLDDPGESGADRFVAPPLAVSDTAGPAYRAEFADAIAPDRWRKLAPHHKRMLDQLAHAAPTSGSRPDADTPDQTRAPERPWICFAPGTADELVTAFSAFSQAGQQARRPDSGAVTAQAFQFLSPARWSRTTLTPSFTSLGQGRPVTLTWSLIPDGTPIPGGTNGAGEPSAPSNLKAWLNGIYGSQAVWQSHFQQVFDRWQALAGVRYVFEPNDDGAAFPSSPGSAGQRGDIRIGGHFIDGGFNTLAYNFGPNTGDMVLDTADSFFHSTTSNSLRLRNVIAHEHGHGLGFAHVCPVDQTKLMEPFASSAFDGPRIDDIFSANRQYGDRLEDTNTDSTSNNNDTSGNATNLDVLPAGTTTLSHLSIDDNNDSDFYRISAPASGYAISVVLRPLGATYLEGAQNADSSCSAGTSFNSLTVHNLGFELRDTNGSTVLSSRNAAAAGADEVLASFPLPGGAGPYFIRVFGGNTNNAQLYELQLTLTAPPPPSTLAIAPLVVAENAATAFATVTLAPSSPSQVAVDYASAPVTAAPSADFTAVSGTLTFPPGTTSLSFPIPILDDTLDEADETVTLNLSNPANATLGTPNSLATITDDDPAPLLAITGTSAPETSPTLDFTLTLSAPSGLTASAAFTTLAGTAAPDADFEARSGAFSIPPGSTSAKVSIVPVDDAEPESDETFTLEVTALENASFSGASTAVGRILDDDAPKTLAGSGSLADGGPGGAVTLGWLSVPGRTYSVDFSDDLIQWNPVPGAERLTGNTFTLPPGATGRRFYRVRDDPAP